MKQLLKTICLAAVLHTPVSLFAQTMVISTVAGNGTDGFSGDGGPATAAQLFNPADVAADAVGNLYIADYRNHRIRQVDAATGIINTIAGSGSPGFYGDGGLAVSAYLNYPTEIKLDAAHNIYINDGLNRRIRKIDAVTGIITTIIGGGSTPYYNGIQGTALNSDCWPSGMGLDAAGNCYFMDGGPGAMPRVLRWDAGTGIVTPFIDSAADTGYSGDGGPALDAQLNNLNYYPGISMAPDASGNVYVTDIYNFRVRKVDAAGIITTYAGNGIGSTSGDGGPATAASVGLVYKPAVSSTGELYFFSNIGIRKVNPTTQIITTIAGGGTSYAEGIPATAAKLYSPYGISVDGMQNVYYADHNGRIRKLTPGCTSVTSGSIISSFGNSFCDSASTTLSLSLMSGGVDISYQWARSTDGITWTNVGTSNVSYSPTGIYTTTYFKAYVTCNTAGITDSTAIDTITVVPCSLGVPAMTGGGHMKLYPNPNSGTFNIEVPSPVNESVYVTVTDILGRVVRTFTVPTNELATLHIDAPAGIYQLSVSSANCNEKLKVVITE